MIDLSEGVDAPVVERSSEPPEVTRLSAGESEALLERLPVLVGSTTDEKKFVFRDRSPPPPRTGETTKGTFPPPESGAAPPAKEDKPLTVLRYAPDGDVPLAPHLSVTFSKPMVAVTSHSDTVASGVPVQLSPEPKGKWRWVGTRTLLFDPAVRFPQATTYRVSVKGAKAADGTPLRKDVKWSFSTPPPQMNRHHPSGEGQSRDPLLFVGFDQRVDPARVLARLDVRAGGRSLPIRLATQESIESDATVKRLVASADSAGLEGRHVVFRAAGLLPYDSDVTVTVRRGTPSAEGPLKTKTDQSFTFRTHGPLKVEEARCGWQEECRPGQMWWVRFSNALSPNALEAAGVRIEPSLARADVEVSGNQLVIRGQSKGQTTYRVTLPSTLEDRFGQTLGQEETVEFAVGSAYPRLFGAEGVVVLDPAAKAPTFDVFSVNEPALRVQVRSVTPADWGGFVSYMRDFRRYGRQPKLPGKAVIDKTVRPSGARDEIIETSIDLSEALQGGRGQVFVRVQSLRRGDRNPPVLNAWVQATAIGLDAFADDEELVIWANSLSSGAPLEGVELELTQSTVVAKTDHKGVVAVPLPGQSDGQRLIVARKGNDLAILPEGTQWWSSSSQWQRRERLIGLRWFVYDDRAMYRPGEEVHLKGWMRRVDHGQGGDLLGAGDVSSVAYQVIGPRGNDLVTGKASVSPLGGFDVAFELPKTPNLGWARVRFETKGVSRVGAGSHVHSFQIQEFRRPEFEVTTTPSEGPHVVGEATKVTVDANYYAGGPLADAPVQWTVTSSPGQYTPPNRADYTFGRWRPWWRPFEPDGAESTSVTYERKTDAAGRHVLQLAFKSVQPPEPTSVLAQASVTDVNRQVWTSATPLLVHPADDYVGLKRERYFVEQGQPIHVDLLVVDRDGKVRPGRPVEVEAVRLDWDFGAVGWQSQDKDRQVCKATSGGKDERCSFETPEGGTYRITATVRDDKGRPNQTVITMWVSGGKRPPARDVEQEEVMLIPDQENYKPGDVAEVLVQAPFTPAEGLMTVRRSGIVTFERFTMKKSAMTLRVPIQDGHTPNVFVQVDLVGSTGRLNDDGTPATDLPNRPAYAMGVLQLKVPPRHRSLQLDVRPDKAAVEPGGETKLAIKVQDASGRPVKNAELSVVVVDEAVLALSGVQTPDPLAAFYPERPAGGSEHHNRAFLRLARPDDQALDAPEEAEAMLSEGIAASMPASPRARKMARADMDDSAGGGTGGGQQVALRKDFNALAVFAPEVRTDKRGRATVEVNVPDNITRYRVMVAAAAGERQFGSGESAITARLPLMVRPSPPRFLNFGDVFELPVVLQNQTEAALDVKVAVRGLNLGLTEGAGRSVRVPANGRVEVRFPAAAELPGTARFQVVGAAGGWTDASQHALPVWTPATTEAFATYGEVDRGATYQRVTKPSEVVEEYGGLEVTTSSTQLQALTDAFLYLVAYPFECSEQLASRVLGVVALWDVLDAFDAEGLPSPDVIRAALSRDLENLGGLQNRDGGFGFWYRGSESWPYISIHVAHALVRAQARGIEVPEATLKAAMGYAQNIARHIPASYPDKIRRSLVAYALYVRKLSGDADAKRARALINEAGVSGLSIEAKGWLLSVLAGDSASSREVAVLRRDLGRRVTETAATATFVSEYQDGEHLVLHSGRRDDAVVLEALIESDPQSDLIPKVVRGLLAHRVRGRWQNTQENVFVLLALDRYFKTYEKVTPNFTARLWLGQRLAGEERFKGRETKRHHVSIPMGELRGGGENLVVQKDGKGRLYYRIGMTYAPKSLKVGAADHGFAVERQYESVDDASDVERLEDGSWRIKAGARVRVSLSLVVESRRYHVALVDPLPAGLEPLNPALAVTGALPQDPSTARGAGWWWPRTWYEHQNMRDERVEAFSSLVGAGVYEYSYIARATTPGDYIVPPAKAEEMYFPETFGRSASDRVRVE